MFINILKDIKTIGKTILCRKWNGLFSIVSSASIFLKDNKYFMLIVVKKNSLALRYASERLRDDKELILEAIKENPFALQYASKRICDDKDVVLQAMKRDIYVLEYSSERLQNNKDMLEFLEKCGFIPILDFDWYIKKIDMLANIREKELMEKNITHNKIKSKKIKF